MSEFKGTKGKWTFSSQKGTKNHCLQAQIWSDLNEEYVASLNSTENEIEATANAKLIACAPELLQMLKHLDLRGGLGISTHKDINDLIQKATE